MILKARMLRSLQYVSYEIVTWTLLTLHNFLSVPSLVIFFVNLCCALSRCLFSWYFEVITCFLSFVPSLCFNITSDSCMVTHVFKSFWSLQTLPVKTTESSVLFICMEFYLIFYLFIWFPCVCIRPFFHVFSTFVLDWRI